MPWDCHLLGSFATFFFCLDPSHLNQHWELYMAFWHGPDVTVFCVCISHKIFFGKSLNSLSKFSPKQFL